MEKYGIILPEEEKVEPIMESYYGKLPEFTALEAAFDRLIKRARSEGNKCNPNKYKENKEISGIFKKVFGFKDAIIYWIPSYDVNAFTICIQSLMLFGESKDFIEKRSDKGFYDTSHRSVLTVYVYTGMLEKDLNITAREMVAIVLHEIGHNFDYSLYHMVNFIIDAIYCMGSNIIWVDNNRRIEDVNKIKMDNYDYLKSESEAIYNDQNQRDKDAEAYKKSLQKYANKGWFKGVLKLLYTNIAHLLLFPVALPLQLSNIGNHKGEQFADSFATSYGYGVELVSGLDKMNSRFVFTKKSRGLQILEDLNHASMEIFSGMSGEAHGTNQERCKECIKKLRRDLKNEDFPPELKNELEHEISKIEARYQELMTATPNDKLRITKLWRKVCDLFFGGANNLYKFFKPNNV